VDLEHPWLAVHGVFDFPSKLQTIETYTPVSRHGGQCYGAEPESVFYDPEAFVEPIRIVLNTLAWSGFEEGDPPPFTHLVTSIRSGALDACNARQSLE